MSFCIKKLVSLLFQATTPNIIEPFLQRGFRKASDFYNPNMLLQTLRLKTFNSADSMINHFITNPRLRQVLSFQTLYIGISPKTGPSLYTIIPMIEWLYGVWFIKGGMYAIDETKKA